MTGNPDWTEDQGRPGTPAPPHGGFRIGTMLAWTAVIAVCLAAFRAEPGLGLLASCSLVPAIIRTSIVSRKRRLVRQAMDFREQAFMLIETSLYSAWVTVINICVFAISWIWTRYWVPSAVAVSISLTITIMLFTLDRKPFDSEEPRR